MSALIREAATPEEFLAGSTLIARGWKRAYPGFVPDDYLEEVCTDDHWVDFLRSCHETDRSHTLMAWEGDVPMAVCAFGPGGIGLPHAAGAQNCAGMAEIYTFYANVEHLGGGYGSALMDAALARLRQDGWPAVFLMAMKEADGACRFHERHGFAWDGTSKLIPFPHDMVCTDLRYVQQL